MGFNVLLDIIGAIFIGGILIITLYRAQDSAITNLYYYNSDLGLQRNLLDIIKFVENDLKKVGYCAKPELFPDPTKAILFADTSKLRFMADIENVGKMDTIEYKLGPTSELNQTENPNDRILYCYLNSDPNKTLTIGVVTQFSITYYNSLNQIIPTPIVVTGEIAYLEFLVRVESSDTYNQNYANAYWRQVRLAARNLKSR